MNKHQWNFNQNKKKIIQEDVSENIVCEKAAILFRGRWVNLLPMVSSVSSLPSHFFCIICRCFSGFATSYPCGIWYHDDVIKWKHFPRYWPFVRGIHRFPVNSPHKGQWRGALMFSLICPRINNWVNNGEAGHFRRHRAHYVVTVMPSPLTSCFLAVLPLCLKLRSVIIFCIVKRTFCICSHVLTTYLRILLP